MIFSVCVAIANYAIYMSTIDYMVAAYGVYSASATGGNGFARDFLAGVSAMYATVRLSLTFLSPPQPSWSYANAINQPLYENVGGDLHLEYGSTILACLAVMVTIPIYVAYVKGPWIRKKSKFAQSLDVERRESAVRRASSFGG